MSEWHEWIIENQKKFNKGKNDDDKKKIVHFAMKVERTIEIIYLRKNVTILSRN